MSTLYVSRVALAATILLASSASAQWSYLEEAAIDSQAQFGSNCGLGHSVDLDGDTAVVGVPHPGAGGVTGHAVVYRKSNGTWIQEADLVPSDGTTGNYFGMSVGISGDTIVVGASSSYIQGQSAAGAAYVFQRSGSTWTEQQKLFASDFLQGAEFGWSVGISGSTLLVGAPQATYANDGGRGAAYVYQKSGSSWVFLTKLAGVGTTIGARNGSSVAIDGDRLVIGARTTFEDGGTTIGTGSGYVFLRTGGVWTQEAKLQSSSYVAWALLGTSAAIDGTRVVLGAVGEDFNEGAAYVFDRVGASWVQKARLTGLGTDAPDGFGFGVGVSESTVVVGAYGYDNPLPLGSGAVKLFSYDGAQWTERLELLGSVMTTGDTLGESCAIQGDLVIGGSPSIAHGQFGKAWIWNVEPPVVETYCIAKVTGAGCTPAIASSGTPSATLKAPFLVTAAQVTPNQPGMLFYGFGPNGAPFLGGTLCVRAPVTRTPVQNSGGSSNVPCSGHFSFDFNARIQSGIDPALVAGEDIYMQYWFRDPQGPQGVGLTDAIRCRIQP